MEDQNKKCSSKNHKELDAIFYCQQCKIYMCNKCEKYHCKLFETQKHDCLKLDQELNEISSRYCKEENHYNEKLEYFCKDHNRLCCALCLCKIKNKGKGQHKDCDACEIEDIKEEKKNKLQENINYLENISKAFKESINELKQFFKTKNEEKEKLKLDIQKTFTKIRNVLNDKEDKLLLEVDKIFKDVYFDDSIFQEFEKSSEYLKKLIEKGKDILNKEWNNDKLISLIDGCIYTENNIKTINIINERMKECIKSQKYKIKFNLEEENKLNPILDSIKTFGDIYKSSDLKFFNDSLIINKNLYEKNIIKWIQEENININKTELLYRKTKDGNSYDIFHKLCDNKGATLVLIKGLEGFIVGGFTPTDWDNYSIWKRDEETFLFSLTKNKKFKKKKEISIYCGKEQGPWFPGFGFRETGKKNMTQGEFLYYNYYFEDIYEIIPHEEKDRFFDVEEVEIYKIYK